MVIISQDVDITRGPDNLYEDFAEASEALFDYIESRGIAQEDLYYGIITRTHSSDTEFSLRSHRVWNRSQFEKQQRRWIDVLESIYEEDGFADDHGLASGDIEMLQDGFINRATFDNGDLRIILVASSPYI
jgi:hypothetical protein